MAKSKIVFFRQIHISPIDSFYIYNKNSNYILANKYLKTTQGNIYIQNNIRKNRLKYITWIARGRFMKNIMNIKIKWLVNYFDCCSFAYDESNWTILSKPRCLAICIGVNPRLSDHEISILPLSSK